MKKGDVGPFHIYKRMAGGEPTDTCLEFLAVGTTTIRVEDWRVYDWTRVQFEKHLPNDKCKIGYLYR